MMMGCSTLQLVALLAALAGLEAAKYGKPTLSTGPGVEGSTSILVYIRINSTMDFTCKNGKDTPKEHQWLKDGVLFNTTPDLNILRRTFAWSDSGTYTCKLIATNAADNSDTSSPLVIKAGGPPLGSELVIKSSGITSSGATIAWKKPASPSESFTSYKVVIKQETEGATITVPSNDAENPSCALTNLKSYTFYTVTVSTVTVYGSVKIEGLPKTWSFVTRSAASLHVPVAMNIYITSASMVALFASAVSGITM